MLIAGCKPSSSPLLPLLQQMNETQHRSIVMNLVVVMPVSDFYFRNGFPITN